MNIEGLLSSNSEEWETPQDIFDRLNHLFDFQLDVCASDDNKKCSMYYTKHDNGLSKPWKNRNWMNPPYGREIGTWCAKANFEAIEFDVLTVALLPARTDTNWYHTYCKKWHTQFLKGRLKFRIPYVGGYKTGSAPFPSMIVYFGIER